MIYFEGKVNSTILFGFEVKKNGKKDFNLDNNTGLQNPPCGFGEKNCFFLKHIFTWDFYSNMAQEINIFLGVKIYLSKKNRFGDNLFKIKKRFLHFWSKTVFKNSINHLLSTHFGLNLKKKFS